MQNIQMVQLFELTEIIFEITTINLLKKIEKKGKVKR